MLQAWEAIWWIFTIPTAHDGIIACVDSVFSELWFTGKQSIAAFPAGVVGRHLNLSCFSVCCTAPPPPAPKASQSVLILDLHFSNHRYLASVRPTALESNRSHLLMLIFFDRSFTKLKLHLSLPPGIPNKQDPSSTNNVQNSGRWKMMVSKKQMIPNSARQNSNWISKWKKQILWKVEDSENTAPRILKDRKSVV